MNRSSLAILALVLLVPVHSRAEELRTDEERGRDLTHLSLEELAEIRVAPLNVLGIHTHFEDEWMVSYRPMVMAMKGLRDGTRSLLEAEVLADFPVTPTEMTMVMHMAGFMFAPSDRLTLMVMVPVLDLEMDHRTRSGAVFTTSSTGLGDLKAGASWEAATWGDGRRLLLSGKLGIPTGSTDERGATPMSADAKLPYPMQLGSGTWDLLPAVTYLQEGERWAGGAEAAGTLRTGDSGEGYTLGDRLALSGWVDRLLTEEVSVTATLFGETWGNVSGADPELNPAIVPTADPGRRGGEILEARLRVDVFLARGSGSEGLRFALESAHPIHQSLDGPQLEQGWTLRGGLQWTSSF